MFCKYCGQQNSDDSNFCIKCGKPIKGGCENHNFGNKCKLHKTKVFLKTAICFLAVFIVGCAARSFREGGQKAEEQATPGFKQVLPIEDGSVAVVYMDGTVKVSGNDYFAEAVSDWKQIKHLYYDEYSVFNQAPILAGLTDDGTVLTTEGDLLGWQGVDELHFGYQGIAGVTKDGNVLTYGEVECGSVLSGLKNVESLVPGGPWGDYWGCLRKDGTVTIIDGHSDPNTICWENVKELRDSGHALYAIRNDGSVVSRMENDYSALQGAHEVVSCSDWLFGISTDGRLLTYKNGNIYTNIGSWMVDEPGSSLYGGEVDVRQFDQIKDIVVFGGLLLLNKDGTVDTIHHEPKWDIDDWTGIKKIYATEVSDTNTMSIYGIREDNSVIVARFESFQMIQKVTEQYKNWRLQEIYTCDGGVVGLTIEGKLVGDGIFAETDFSVLTG